MTDLNTSIKDVILQRLEDLAGDAPHPVPPESYLMSSIEISAMSVFESNGRLTQWMLERGLDPQKGQDAVLGLGLLVTMDDKINPRPEYEHFEYPDDHDH
jgi:hypothetical protein